MALCVQHPMWLRDACTFGKPANTVPMESQIFLIPPMATILWSRKPIAQNDLPASFEQPGPVIVDLLLCRVKNLEGGPLTTWMPYGREDLNRRLYLSLDAFLLLPGLARP